MTFATINLAYKYTAANRLSYFENELMRFSQPGCLNDPFECYPGLPVLAAGQLLEMNAKGSAFREGLTKRNVDGVLVPYLEQIAKRINQSIGMLCLSERWNSTLMWSHYADSHQGFCVGFDITHPFFANDYLEDGGWGPIGKVNYADHRRPVTLERVSIKEVLALLTTKHIDWAYENEMRLIRSIGEADDVQIVKDGMSVALFRVPHDAVREIYCGARASTQLKDALRIHATKLGIKFYEAEMSIVRYDLDRWPREA